MNSRLAIFNQKGGVGKTTTTLNLGAALARRGHEPILVDLDAQAHLTSILAPTGHGADSLYAFYAEAKAFASVSRKLPGGGEIFPAHAEMNKVNTVHGRGPDILNRLRRGLDLYLNGGPERPVLIDCCPMLGVLSLSGIFAAERVLVPIAADHLSVKGAYALEKTLAALENVFKHRIERRYVITRFDARRRMSHDIAEQLKERFGAELCATRIAETAAIAESPALGRDVFSHAPESRGAADYDALLEELTGTGFLVPAPTAGSAAGLTVTGPRPAPPGPVPSYLETRSMTSSNSTEASLGAVSSSTRSTISQ